MKKPARYSEDEEDLAQFVTAADSGELSCACDLLFMQATDLIWAGALALVDRVVDPDFEEDFAQKLTLIRTRVEHSVIPLIRWLMPVLRQAHLDFPGDSEVPTEARIREIINGLGAHLSSAALTNEIGGLLMRNSQVVTDGIADALLTSGLRVRDRLVRGSGLSEDAYGAMVDALRELQITEGPVLRVSLPPGDSYPEISFAGPQGLQVTNPHEDASCMDVYGLNARVTKHKIGQDNALSLFISRYLNQHSISEEQVAYACARYKGKSEAELDVVVPELGCAFEIKLYESAWTLHTDSKIKVRAEQLERQFRGYADAKVNKVYLVTNLQKSTATELLRNVNKSELADLTIETPICETQALLSILRQMNDDLTQRTANKLKMG